MAVMDQMQQMQQQAPPPAGPPMPPQGGGVLGDQAQQMGDQGEDQYSIEGDEKATEDEQNAYDNVVALAIEMIKSKAQMLLQMVNNAPSDSADTVGDIVAGLLMKMDADSQGKINETVVIPAAENITCLLYTSPSPRD